MPNEINVVTTAITGVVSLISGGLISTYAYRLSRKEKRIRHDEISMDLVMFESGEDSPVSIALKRKYAGQDGEPIVSIGVVDNLTGHVIDIVNIGNETVEDLIAEVAFDNPVEIVFHSTEPRPRPGFALSLEASSESSQTLHLQVPYINKDEQIRIKVMTIGKTKAKCRLDIRAKDTKVLEGGVYMPMTPRWVSAVVLGFVALFYSIALYLYFIAGSALGAIFPIFVCLVLLAWSFTNMVREMQAERRYRQVTRGGLKL